LKESKRSRRKRPVDLDGPKLREKDCRETYYKSEIGDKVEELNQ
jgi:hypothetical protein